MEDLKRKIEQAIDLYLAENHPYDDSRAVDIDTAEMANAVITVLHPDMDIIAEAMSEADGQGAHRDWYRRMAHAAVTAWMGDVWCEQHREVHPYRGPWIEGPK